MRFRDRYIEKRIEMPKISIIIPVYNVEDYIRKCLESVINQTERDLEIIIVNDCSTDNSEEIIKEYEAKDRRIAYIKHEVNKHAGGARNTGLEVATGEYLWFIDGDDWIDTNACEILYNTAKKNELDILGFEMNYVIDLVEGLEIVKNWHGISKSIGHLNNVWSGVDLLEKTCLDKSYRSSSWAYLTLGRLAKSTRFPEGVAHQDEDWTLELLLQAKRAMVIRYAPYYYLTERAGSIMTTSFADASLSAKNHLRLLIRLIEKHLEQKEQKIYVLMTLHRVLAGWGQKIEDHKKDEGIKENYQKFLGLYKKFTGKEYLLKDIVNPSTAVKEKRFGEIKKEISGILQKYYEGRKKVWKREWVRFRDRYILRRGYRCR